MDRSTPIVLISKTYTIDSIGQQIATETRRSVYAKMQSVTRSEFFAAGEDGIKPSLVATMFEPDYQGEEICELTMFGHTDIYTIYRTYLRSSDTLELYLEKRVGK